MTNIFPDNFFKKVPSTLFVNLINFSTKIVLTFILGDLLKIDPSVYYAFVLMYLFFQGYFLHSRYNFKTYNESSLKKYFLHTTIFSISDYFLFNFFISLFDTYQFVTNIISSGIIWLVRFTSLRYFVFKEEDTNNPQNSDIQKKHYDSYAHTKVKRDLNNVTSQARKKFVTIPLKNIDNLGNLMDFGCGNGALVNYLDQYYTSYKGFDISKKQIENANKFFSDFENVSFHEKNLKEKFDLSEKFDSVYSFGVLHHMTDLKQTVHNVNDILKVGGIFIIVEPHRGGFFINTLRNIRKVIDPSYDETQFFFRKGEIEKLVPQNFKLIDREFFGFLLPYFAHFPLKPRFLFMPLLKLSIYLDDKFFNKFQNVLKNYLWMQYLIYEKE